MKTGMKSLGLSFLCLLTCSVSSFASDIAFESEQGLPIVNINVAIKAGAVTDPLNKMGLTHFTGEMLLRGTKSKTKEQIDLALDQMGARLEVEVRSEALIIRGAVLSKELEPFLALVSEVMTQPKFPEVEIRKLKSEVISLIQEELGHDASLASRKFNEFLFQDHPYAKPILGKTNDIKNLTATQIRDHYTRLFQNQELLVVGTGYASKDRISAWATDLEHQFSKPGAKSIAAKVPPPKESDHRRLLIVDKPDRTQTQIYGGQVGVKMTDKSFFPLYLGNYAFGGPSFSAILMVEVRVKRGWSYGANSSFRHALQPRSWSFHLFPAEKDTSQALALTFDLIESLKKTGISDEKFEFAKQSLINSSGFMFNTPKKRVENKLIERTLDLPDGFMRSFGDELKKVSFKDVNGALNHFLKPNQMAVTVLGTASHLKEGLSKAVGIPLEQVEIIPYTAE